ncbi:MAG: SGNH/GDSL hydrolase family protein [Myxococcales bacterium]|nr:SGNH/GDSL hydrolase family protein [Myxococcales bacterium]
MLGDLRKACFLAVFVIVGCSADDGGSAGAGGGSSFGGSAGAAGSASGGAAGVASGGAAGSSVGGSAGQSTGGTAGSSSGGTGAGGAGGTGGSAGSAALTSVGSLVVLGDSMSDGGGTPPFYYNLLQQDLKVKFPTLSYKNNAQSGSKTSALVGQIKNLPATLPGPVAVCITSGGNDMKAELAAIIGGLDGPARATMGANISAALDALLAPGRFGAGVAVHVFEANIYDASDGQGNFGANNCAFGKGLPAIPTTTFFANWNGEIAKQVAAKGQYLTDIHGLFLNHGFNNPPNWYASDCTHPNSTGHDQLRRHFYFKITGETLP